MINVYGLFGTELQNFVGKKKSDLDLGDIKHQRSEWSNKKKLKELSDSDLQEYCHIYADRLVRTKIKKADTLYGVSKFTYNLYVATDSIGKRYFWIEEEHEKYDTADASQDCTKWNPDYKVRGLFNYELVDSGTLVDIIAKFIYNELSSTEANTKATRYRVHEAGSPSLTDWKANDLKHRQSAQIVNRFKNAAFKITKDIDEFLDDTKDLKFKFTKSGSHMTNDLNSDYVTIGTKWSKRFKPLLQELKDAYRSYDDEANQSVDQNKILNFYCIDGVNGRVMGIIKQIANPKVPYNQQAAEGPTSFTKFLSMIETLIQIRDDMRKTVVPNLKSQNFSSTLSSLMSRVARINNFACTGRWFCPECGKEMESSKCCNSCGYTC